MTKDTTNTAQNLEQSVTLTLENVAPYALEQAITRVWEAAGQYGYSTNTEPSVIVSIRLEYIDGEDREGELSDALTRAGLDTTFDHSGD